MVSLKNRTWDIDWYLSIAKSVNGSVLELGAGTARILVPFLMNGIDAYGLEYDEGMLDFGKAKIEQDIGGEKSSRLVLGDMRNFFHDRQYSFIFLPYNTLSVLQNELEVKMMMSCIEKHLKKGGLFAFDVIVAESLPWSKPPFKWTSDKQFTYNGELIMLNEEGAFNIQNRLLEIDQTFRWVDGRIMEENIQLHMKRVGELEDFFYSNGWTFRQRVDDKLQPFAEGSVVYAAILSR